MQIFSSTTTLCSREEHSKRVALLDERLHFDIVGTALCLQLLLQRGDGLMGFANGLALLFLERLAILAFLRFHLGTHLTNDPEQLLILRLQDWDVAEEYEVIGDNLIDVFCRRIALVSLQLLIRRNCGVLSPGNLLEQRLNLPSKVIQLLLKQFVLAIGLCETLGGISGCRDTRITFCESVGELRRELSCFGLQPLVLCTLLSKYRCLGRVRTSINQSSGNSIPFLQSVPIPAQVSVTCDRTRRTSSHNRLADGHGPHTPQ